ncbi:MAG: carboxypeptidase-like regulatory domain-containing protein, partial [Mariniphaga sp.]
MTKLTFFLSLFLVLQMSANVYSQTRLSVESKNKTVKEVLWEIEKQSEFRFFYNEDFVNMERRVGFNIENETIAEIMDHLFDPAKFSYKMTENNLIVIIPAEGQQPQTVRGKVTTTQGEPIPGVTVMLKGTTTGTVTDNDGDYSITVREPTDVLVFSFVGLLTQEFEVGEQSTINVTMKEDIVGVDEVVIVGYGSQRKVNLTGAIATVDGEELARRQVAQSSMVLQGVAPGVVVTQRSGQPGRDGGTISIRGKTTLGNSNPLILVDGIEMGINNIDPTLIESVSILKDAASSSIYGSRAANGVILVTTKRGQQDKLSISYNGYAGTQQPTYLPDMVGAIDHMLLTNEAYVNVGKSPLYSEEYIEEYRQGMASNPDRYPDTD